MSICFHHHILRTLRFSQLNYWRRNFSSDTLKHLDAEKLFLQPNVQERLKLLTGFDASVVFRHRPTPQNVSPRYMFMTDEDLEMSQQRASRRGKKVLEMVPYLSPREDIVDVLTTDPEIQGLEKSRIVFTDISDGAVDKNRLIVVREPNGVLRRANRLERLRMNQIYFPVEGRSQDIPKMFEDENLRQVLDRGDYFFILERCCLQFEPDDPLFVSVTHQVYQEINQKMKFDVLKSTRHFGPMTFHLVVKDMIDNLLLYVLRSGSPNEAKSLVELYLIVHPDKTTVLDVKGDIVEAYIKNISKSHELLLTFQAMQEQDRNADQDTQKSVSN